MSILKSNEAIAVFWRDRAQLNVALVLVFFVNLMLNYLLKGRLELIFLIPVIISVVNCMIIAALGYKINKDLNTEEV